MIITDSSVEIKSLGDLCATASSVCLIQQQALQHVGVGISHFVRPQLIHYELKCILQEKVDINKIRI